MNSARRFHGVGHRRIRACAGILTVQISRDLCFTGAGCLRSCLVGTITSRPNTSSLLLVYDTVGRVSNDTLSALRGLVAKLHRTKIAICLDRIGKPIVSRLIRTNFVSRLNKTRQIFLDARRTVGALKGIPT